MNWERVEGQWNQLKGELKSKWAKLTDDDLRIVGGKREQLIGKLQERYGVMKDRSREAGRRLDGEALARSVPAGDGEQAALTNVGARRAVFTDRPPRRAAATSPCRITSRHAACVDRPAASSRRRS